MSGTRLQGLGLAKGLMPGHTQVFEALVQGGANCVGSRPLTKLVPELLAPILTETPEGKATGDPPCGSNPKSVRIRNQKPLPTPQELLEE